MGNFPTFFHIPSTPLLEHVTFRKFDVSCSNKINSRCCDISRYIPCDSRVFQLSGLHISVIWTVPHKVIDKAIVCTNLYFLFLLFLFIQVLLDLKPDFDNKYMPEEAESTS